ncbi:unnamed protein product [Prorocentrum cordatum]|uniref:Uncharacterized protein n=1 Tax=Prorocentrum cordatum TaxID=2364126 RepID=A0ABN9W481_9DINO|nr:unnamed protein product [Polarella glacialis]
MGVAPRHYAEGEGQRTAFVLSCALWFAMSGCVLLVRAAMWFQRNRPVRLTLPGLGSMARRCRATLLLIAGAQDAKVVEELQRRRLVRARTLGPYIQLGITILLGATFARVASPDDRVASQTMDIAWIMGCYANLFAWAFPQFLTLRALDIWFSVKSACLALYVSPLAMQGSFAPSFDFVAFMVFIVLSLENGNVRLNIAWLLVITLSMWSTIVLDPAWVDPDRSSLHVLLRASDRSSHHVLVGAMLVALVMLAFQKSLSMVVIYELEANTSRSELEAARSVLRAVCDVTVELDAALRLQDESPALVDMLMLNPGRSWPGTDLRSFLASEQDRQKFSEQMGRAFATGSDSSGLCAAFHVCMKDGSGIPLDVEVFGVGFANRRGEPAYFVGIREFTDTCPLLEGSTVVGTHAGRRGHRQDALGAHGGSARQDVPIASSSSLAQGEAEDPPAAGAAAWVEVLTRGYSVRCAAPAFTHHVDANGQFLSALSQSQRFDFISWVQEAYPALVEDGSASARREYHSRLHFRRPSLAAASAAQPLRVVTSALVQLDLSPPPGEQRCSDGLARIALWDFRSVRGSHDRGPF